MRYKALLAASAFVAIAASPASAATSFVVNGFEGGNLVQAIGFGRGFIPPDTMGAVGTTQYVSPLNGSFNVFDKHTGAVLSQISDVSFWNSVGQSGANGDARVMFNQQEKRWVVIAFASDTSFLNIAVSDTDNALGSWKSTSFEGFHGATGGGVADYPTLAFDSKAAYIGTNNFDSNFQSTTLNVIPLKDIFKATGPTAANRSSFVTAFTGDPNVDQDRGFAIQGVNSNGKSVSGKIVADGIYTNAVAYNVNNPGSASATLGNAEFPAVADYFGTLNARQPDGTRNLNTIGTRISGSAWEQDGKIYFVRTLRPDVGGGNPGADDVARITVLDAATFAVLQEIDIAKAGYDIYQPSLAISKYGLVVGYNRSGFNPADGNIAFLANAYTFGPDGKLVLDGTHLLRYSANNGYHLGSPRNRWGDYSAVSADPLNGHRFFAIGEYANFGPGNGNGNGTSDRWGTYIGEVSIGVPEAATWAMMIAGFGLVGGAMRRRNVKVTYA